MNENTYRVTPESRFTFLINSCQQSTIHTSFFIKLLRCKYVFFKISLNHFDLKSAQRWTPASPNRDIYFSLNSTNFASDIKTRARAKLTKRTQALLLQVQLHNIPQSQRNTIILSNTASRFTRTTEHTQAPVQSTRQTRFHQPRRLQSTRRDAWRQRTVDQSQRSHYKQRWCRQLWFLFWKRVLVLFRQKPTYSHL